MIRISLGTWALVALYAVLHDQGIVWLAPEHFTVGHPAIPGVSDPRLQAAILAFIASIGPGLAFGIALAFACCEGPWPTLGTLGALRLVVVTLILTEATAIALGTLSWSYHWKVFGPGWYPDWSDRYTVTSQTIQLTAYVGGAGYSALAIAAAMLQRHHLGRRRSHHE